MATSCFTKSNGENYSKVRFDSSVNSEEEDRRTARGVELRRQRKELKKMADRNREARINATLNILRSESRAAVLVRLCSRGNRVGGILNLFLDDFVNQNERMGARLAGFRQLPRNRLHLSAEQEMLLMTLNVNSEFSHAFAAYLPSTDDDSPRTRRRSRRQARWRQTVGNHASAQRAREDADQNP